MKKFGWKKKPKNRKCKKFGIQTSKEYRKERRKLLKRVKHCLLFHIPLSKEDSEWFNRYGRLYNCWCSSEVEQ